MLKLKVDVKPLSSNGAYTGRRYATDELTSFKEWCAYRLRGKGKVGGFVQIHYKFYVRYFWGCDTDNMIKPFQDALVESNIIDDDINVIKVTAEKIALERHQEDYIEVEIKNIRNATTKLWKLSKLKSKN